LTQTQPTACRWAELKAEFEQQVVLKATEDSRAVGIAL
jgi:hypothetical protein